MSSSTAELLIPEEEQRPQVDPESSSGEQTAADNVIPIREDIKKVTLAKLEDDLRYARAILENPNVTDSPRWDKAVKTLMSRRAALEQEIAQLQSEIRAEEGMN